jgi:hypothetical protein
VNMPSLDFAQLLGAEGFKIEEAPFFPDTGVSFWHSNILDSSGHSKGAGFGSERLYARKVAVAEFLERRTVREISKRPNAERDAWGMGLIPTACGFAAGFEKSNTIIRSLSEATERWVMSKWIDDNCSIEEVPVASVSHDLDEVSRFIVSQFQDVRLFKKVVRLDFGNLPVEVCVAQTFGLLDEGIYPGSSAQAAVGPIWQHAFLESFRHLLFVRNNPIRPNRFPDDKIHFFSKNASVAISQIDRPKTGLWPEPKVEFHRVEHFAAHGFFLARTILSGWTSWHLGPTTRFLY